MMNGSWRYRRGSAKDLMIGTSDQRAPSKPRVASDQMVKSRPARSGSCQLARRARSPSALGPGASAAAVAGGEALSVASLMLILGSRAASAERTTHVFRRVAPLG